MENLPAATLIALAQSDRLEEALAHELLHLELVRLGYPRFWFDGGDGIAKAIQTAPTTR